MSTGSVVQDYFSRLEQKKDWDSLFADDMAFTSFATPINQLAGKTAYLEATRRFFSMVVSVELRDLIVEANKACALTRYQLRPPSGSAFQSDVAELFTVRDGKIASLRIYFDSARFRNSLRERSHRPASSLGRRFVTQR